ncbi:MAG: surface lipoprotein assembly modifier [Betaproteobacteria bacterium]
MQLGKTILAAVLVAATTAAFADALTDRARQLLRERQHKQAYELLLPQEPSRAGDPEFDYLLGIAAIDAGDPERGIFALERVLALQPDNHVARAEIARAYLAVGEREAARREFETVRRQRIPEEAKESIDRYLSAIAAADVTQVRGYLEAGLGYDSNVNSATSQSQIAVPLFGGAIFDFSTSTRRTDHFGSFAGGINYTRKLTPAFALVSGASASIKLHPDNESFNTYTVDGNVGGRLTSGKEVFTLALQLQEFGLDLASFRQAGGVVAQWQHNYHERKQATVFAQFTALEYTTQPIRDADRSVLGIAYGQALSGDYAPVVFLSAYGGQENEKADGVPHLGHDLAGVRLGGQVRVAPGWSVFANASHERRLYGGIDPAFLVRRDDGQSDVAVGLSYLVGGGTTLVLQLAHTKNDSNIVINDFDRTVLSASVRFNF